MPLTDARVPQIFLSLSLGLFFICLANDGYFIEGPNPKAWSDSWMLLLVGWFGLFAGVVAWLGNPLLFFGWLFFSRKKYFLSALFSLTALAFMMSFLLYDYVITSEAPTSAKITGYGLGYWLWLASSGALFVGSVLGARIEDKSQRSDVP